MITLSDEERRRFAAWLIAEAESDRGLIEQAAKLGPAGEIVAKRLRAEMAAALIIAKRLDQTETVTVDRR